LIACFTLYATVAREVHVRQNFEEGFPVDLTGSNDAFIAPSARHSRAIAIFDVNLPQPWRQRPQRFNGIALFVKNHVGRIKIYADIWPLKFCEEFAEGLRRFLSRLQTQRDILGGKDIRHIAQALQQFGKSWIGRIVWKEASMECYERNS